MFINSRKILGMNTSGSKMAVYSEDEEDEEVLSNMEDRSSHGPFEALETEAQQISTFSLKDLNLGDLTTPKSPDFKWTPLSAIKDYDTDEEDVLPPPDDFEGGEYSGDEGTEADEKSEATSESGDAKKRQSKRMSLQKRNATTFAVKKSTLNDEVGQVNMFTH